MKQSIWRRYAYLWITLILFLGSAIAHWIFAWKVYVDEQLQHGSELLTSDYLQQVLRDTFENWQSEFLQLMWQVAGLSFLWYIGSPQSKEGDERKEEKIDLILRALDKDGEQKIKALDRKYPRK